MRRLSWYGCIVGAAILSALPSYAQSGECNEIALPAEIRSTTEAVVYHGKIFIADASSGRLHVLNRSGRIEKSLVLESGVPTSSYAAKETCVDEEGSATKCGSTILVESIDSRCIDNKIEFVVMPGRENDGKAMEKVFSQVVAENGVFRLTEASDNCVHFLEISSGNPQPEDIPVALAADEGFLYVLFRESGSSAENAAWRVAKMAVDDGYVEVLGSVQIPSSHPMLGLAVGSRFWYFIERPIGIDENSSILEIPGGWIRDPKSSPLRGAEFFQLSCIRR